MLVGHLLSQLYFAKIIQHDRPPKPFVLFSINVQLKHARLGHDNSNESVDMARRSGIDGISIFTADQLMKYESFITGNSMSVKYLKRRNDAIVSREVDAGTLWCVWYYGMPIILGHKTFYHFLRRLQPLGCIVSH